MKTVSTVSDVFLSLNENTHLYRYYSRIHVPAGTQSIAVQTSKESILGTKTITVDSRRKWSDTQISIAQGDLLSFTASGQIQWSDRSTDVAGPGGSLTKLRAKMASASGQYAVRNIGVGGLIACIDEDAECIRRPHGRAFRVGEEAKVRVTRAGRLYLGINDNNVSDNSGHFDVQIVVSR